MTIKEQVSEHIQVTHLYANIDAIESVVEDIAIQFAEFYADNMFADKYEHMNIKELYQLFKEENKL